MSIARFIDHTLLKNTTTIAEVEKLCTEAGEYGFAAVCVPPYYVQDARKILEDAAVKVATVIGFPFGYSQYQAKVAETEQALKDGADEIDMVMNLAAFKSNDIAYVENEIAEVLRVAKQQNTVVKVIIESGILNEEEIIRCCDLYKHFPVDFLKTSTGYAEKGASVEAVRLMRQHLPSQIQIKASGGIRTYDFAQQLLDAGATRLGCSASVAIVTGENAPKGDY
jgi:deoxyribose-phosphate aldolase